MAEVKWIKLSTDIFNNRKIRQIEKMPDGDALVVIWLKILTLAGVVNDGGMIYFTKDIPYTDQLLATEFNRPIATIQMALNVFEQFGMIEITDNIICVSNWEKYQSADKLEEIRAQNRIRQANFRERQKALPCNVTDNVTVTQSNATDIDIEEDKKENKSKNISKDIFEEFAQGDADLLEALMAFEQMRKAIKKPMTDKAKQYLLKKLQTFPHHEWLPVIEQSVVNSWASIYPLKKDERSKNMYTLSNGIETSNVFLTILDEEKGEK